MLPQTQQKIAYSSYILQQPLKWWNMLKAFDLMSLRKDYSIGKTGQNVFKNWISESKTRKNLPEK